MTDRLGIKTAKRKALHLLTSLSFFAALVYCSAWGLAIHLGVQDSLTLTAKFAFLPPSSS